MRSTNWLQVASALAVAVSAFDAAPARAELDATVQQAVALAGQGKAAGAYALLAPLAATRAGDPDFDYALGLSAADSGKPGEAIVAFQRVLAVQPRNAQARAELARAYALAGDIDTARAQFDTVVQDPSLPDPVRQRFDRLVRDYGKRIEGGGTDVSGFLDVAGGYDSNINTATDLTSITIPLFSGLGAGTLGGTAREIDRGFVDAQGGVSVVSGVSRQTRLFGSLLGTLRENFNDGNFDQASATGTAGVGHTLASRDVISLSGQIQQFWLGGDSFRQAYGAIAQYTHLLEGGNALSFAAQAFRFDYDGDPLRDSNRYAAAVSYAGKAFIVTGTAGKEQTRRSAGDQLSNGFAGVNLGVETPVAPKLNLVAGLSGELRRYDDADPLFLRKRHDEQIDASIGLKYLIADNVYVRPRVGYTRNFSNIALYDYDRYTASVGVRFEF